MRRLQAEAQVCRDLLTTFHASAQAGQITALGQPVERFPLFLGRPRPPCPPNAACAGGCRLEQASNDAAGRAPQPTGSLPNSVLAACRTIPQKALW